jgi:hypothetical protein
VSSPNTPGPINEFLDIGVTGNATLWTVGESSDSFDLAVLIGRAHDTCS